MSEEHDSFADQVFSPLAVSDVPPVPEELETNVHRRLNTVLIISHLVEFAIHAIPETLGYFLRSVGHWMAFSITGKLTEQDANDDGNPMNE